MAARQIYDPEGFRNIETDGRITGYQFRFKAQYYRGITLSIIRDIQINIDGESAKKEDIRFTVNGETLSLGIWRICYGIRIKRRWAGKRETSYLCETDYCTIIHAVPD